jgi:ribonuclease HII
VVACAVVLKFKEPDLYFDSKLLAEKRREELCARIQAHHDWCVGFATVEEIDRLNILRAALLAMRRAVEGLKLTKGHILVDGKFPVPDVERFKQTPLIKGDMRADNISAASIVAKVTRDRMMKELAREWPGYGFEVHKGYATEQHRVALATLGPSREHRKHFRGVYPETDLVEG